MLLRALRERALPTGRVEAGAEAGERPWTPASAAAAADGARFCELALQLTICCPCAGAASSRCGGGGPGAAAVTVQWLP
jgi:hypothetical protein